MTRAPCPLFVELCAGTAAVSLRLAHPMAKPPVSRMGAKTGYSNALLNALGLAAGQGADAYLWCEPDAGVRLLLEAYRDHALALAAAEVIRGWSDEEPRALWDRLRAEGEPRGPEPREVVRWLNVEAWSNSGRYMGPDRPSACHEPGWVASITSDGIARRADALPTLPATIHPDARTVDPREVARWCLLITRSFGQKGPQAGYAPPVGNEKCIMRRWRLDQPGPELARLPVLPADIVPDARQVEPVSLPEGTVAYIDGPYENTSGYAHLLPRSEQLALARRRSDAGAVVAISEQEPLNEELGEGWSAVEITMARKGPRRTFSKQQAEYLTLNRPSAIRFDGQRSLFGGTT